jgi:hypothetical protein
MAVFSLADTAQRSILETGRGTAFGGRESGRHAVSMERRAAGSLLIREAPTSPSAAGRGVVTKAIGASVVVGFKDVIPLFGG